MDQKIKQIDVSTMQERVYQELRQALYQGRFMPGDTLNVRSLSEALGTSPMPVREAIQRLTAENALVQMPNRTTRVVALTPGNFEEWTRIRVEVEGYATRRAAMRATPDLCDRLRAINAAFRAAVEAEDPKAMLEGNQHFHFTLYRAAGAAELLGIIESLWLRFGPILGFVRNLAGSVVMFERGVEIHERVIAALEGRNARAARAALTLDIRAAASWFHHHHDFNEPIANRSD